MRPWMIAVLAFVSIGKVEGATFTVGPGLGFDHSTFSAAMSSAASGDVILLASGVYSAANGESLPISIRSGVTVRPLVPGARPVISGGGTHQVLRYGGGGPIHLEGLTITEGSAEEGAGLWISFANGATISDCTLTENTGRVGAGFYCWFSNILFERCAVIGNTAMGQGQADTVAGGVCHFGEAEFRQCTFRENRVFGEFGAFAGGLRLNTVATVTDCRFLDNFCLGWCGALYLERPAKVQRCTFVGNIANGISGALYAFNGDSEIDQCDFVRNTCFANTDCGGGLHIGEGRATITRCRFLGNLSNWAGALNFGGGAVAVVENSLFAGNIGEGAGGISSRENSRIAIEYCSFLDNSSLFGCSSVAVVEDGHAVLKNCLTALGEGVDLAIQDAGSSVTAEYCVSHLPTVGFLRDASGVVYSTAQEAEASFPGFSLNRSVNAQIARPIEGVWDAAAVFNPATYTSTIRDSKARWGVGDFGDGRHTVRPNRELNFHFHILSNTTDTLTVLGDVGQAAFAGSEYRIHPLRFSSHSALVDSAAVEGPEVDLVGAPRPFDLPLRGRDGTGDAFDIGAIELQYETPFEGGSADFDGDGAVNARDLYELLESLRGGW